MKIATLTTHRADNYGAVLQAYALQKKINDLGILRLSPRLDNILLKDWCKSL